MTIRNTSINQASMSPRMGTLRGLKDTPCFGLDVFTMQTIVCMLLNCNLFTSQSDEQAATPPQGLALATLGAGCPFPCQGS